MEAEHFDVIIVGAGISGICAAHYLSKTTSASFVCLERRQEIGGTWSLFKYPGLRSDSTMYTFGFSFQPWESPSGIAMGSSIMEYLHKTVNEKRLEHFIRFGQHIVKASFSSPTATWSLETEDGKKYTCGFLYMCGGYYNQDEGYTPIFKNRESFKGQIVHPQHWPEDVVLKDKKVCVIGSGATAITLCPSMPESAHVTMLQRSPSYIAPMRNHDTTYVKLVRWLPASIVHSFMRWKTILRQMFFAWYGRRYYTQEQGNARFIGFARWCIKKEVMSDEVFKKHFTPRYNLWEQRVCFAPNADFFQDINSGHTSIVTDHIEEFDTDGIKLKSGERIDCDVIVTATGLNLQHNFPMATMKVTIDGKPYVANQSVQYKGCMLSDVPNFAYIQGYFVGSWTLKAESVARFVCRVLKHIKRHQYSIVCPRRGDGPEDAIDRRNPGISSGYVKRTWSLQPRFGLTAPWTYLYDYVRDLWPYVYQPLEDGKLIFTKNKPKTL